MEFRKIILYGIFPIGSIAILVSLLIARSMWPADSPEIYSDVWETISGLGDWEINTVGFLYFQIALTILGCMIIPVGIYAVINLWEIQKGWVLIGGFWMLIAAIGFILTGLIPDDTLPINKFHEITSGMGTLGVLFAAFAFYFPCKKAEEEVNQKALIFNNLMWWVPLILAGIAYGIAELYFKPTYNLGWYGPEWGEIGVPAFFSFSLWERVIFTIIILYLGLLVYMIPKKVKNE